MDFDVLLGLVLLGDSGIGKSQIAVRYTEDAFSSTLKSTKDVLQHRGGPLSLHVVEWSPASSSREVGYMPRTLVRERKKVKLQIWDTPGQKKFWGDTCELLRRKCVTGIILVYDITNQRSFDSLPYWLEVIKKKCPDAEVLLVGNKSDLDSERVISKERGQHLASSLGISFRETSPKSDITSVDDAFDTLVRAVLAKIKDIEEEKKAGRCTAM